MQRRLAPLLFKDADPDAAQAARASVVQPAQVSPEARAKARTQCTAAGEPVHSFRTLLDDLATIAKNRIQPQGGGQTVRHAHATDGIAAQGARIARSQPDLYPVNLQLRQSKSLKLKEKPRDRLLSRGEVRARAAPAVRVQRRARARTCLPVHAGLLLGMERAAQAGAVVVRGQRAGRRGGAARLAGVAGAGVAGGPGQGRHQADPGGVAGAQPADPARAPGSAGADLRHAGPRRSARVPAGSPADGFASQGLRSAGRGPRQACFQEIGKLISCNCL